MTAWITFTIIIYTTAQHNNIVHIIQYLQHAAGTSKVVKTEVTEKFEIDNNTDNNIYSKSNVKKRNFAKNMCNSVHYPLQSMNRHWWGKLYNNALQ